MIRQSVGVVLKAKVSQEMLVVPASAKVADAVSVMNSKGVGSVLIRGAGDAVEGIFTERDLMKRVVHEGRDPKSTPVSAVMSPNVRRVSSSATIEEALRLMVVHGYRHLLVEDHSRVTGLVSIRDLMSWLVLPDEPIAAEGRVGVIRARAQDAMESIRGGTPDAAAH